MNPFEIVTLIAWQLIVVGMIFLLLKIYLSVLNFEVVKLSWLARLTVLPLFVIALFLPMISWVTIPVDPWIIFMVVIVSILAVCYATARGNKAYILLAGTFFAVVALTIEVIIWWLIVLLDFEPSAHFTSSVIVVQSVTGVLFTLIILSISKLIPAKEKFSQSVKAGDALPSVLMVFGSGLFLAHAYNIFLDTSAFWVRQGGAVASLMLGLLFVSSAALMTYFSLIKQARNRQENAIYQKQLKFYDDYLQERESNYQYVKILQHDQRQHFGYVLSAMKNNQIEEGVAYLEELMQGAPFGKLEATNNFAINSVLSFKSEKLKEKQIVLASAIEVPEQVHVSDVDLCIILGNLLDNAIEATAQVPAEKRNIKLEIRYDRENLFVSIKNPLQVEPRKGGLGGFVSSKRNPKAHGLGLYSVKHSLKRYDGVLQADATEDMFTATALIYGSKE